MEAAQLAELVQQLTEMRTEVAEGRIEREAFREQLRAQEQRAQDEGLSRGKPRSTHTGLGVDSRQLGRPEHFHGEEDKWRNWCVVFRHTRHW